MGLLYLYLCHHTRPLLCSGQHACTVRKVSACAWTDFVQISRHFEFLDLSNIFEVYVRGYVCVGARSLSLQQ